MDTCDYFKETVPSNYCFLGFYQYRSNQEDFSSSFQKEADKLLKDLNLMSEIGSKDIKKSAIKMKKNFENHRQLEDVNNFWNEIEKNEQEVSVTQTLQCQINIRDEETIDKFKKSRFDGGLPELSTSPSKTRGIEMEQIGISDEGPFSIPPTYAFSEASSQHSDGATSYSKFKSSKTSPRSRKRTKNEFDYICETDGSTTDDYMEQLDPPSPVTNFVTSQKLCGIDKGIGRYSIIFLPECHKNDIIKSRFSDDEWRNLEDIFRKREEEISEKINPPFDKVEEILEEYGESIKKATDGFFVDLEAISFVPKYLADYKFRKHWLSKWVDNVFQKFITCFQLTKHVLNDKSTSEYQYRSWFVNLLCEDIFLDVNNVIRLATGEVENTDRKTQKDLYKLSESRRPTGWFHDGILTVNVNGNNLCIGFLEVVGNAILEDHKKTADDLQKILKAMRLAFYRLEEYLSEKGVADNKKISQNIETFGILVDRREFAFYVMTYHDGAYLVDEILSFTIPDTETQLDLLKGIIRDLLTFRARVEYVNTRIIELMKEATTRRRSRRIMTVINASPKKKLPSIPRK